MAHWLTQVHLERNTHVPEDAFVNTLHWVLDDTDPLAQSDDIADAIEAFYSVSKNYLSHFVALSGNVVKFYDMGDPEPRVPFRTRELDLTDGSFGTGELPCECCICVSFQAPPESGVNQARRRGRIYFGPISLEALDEGTGDMVVSETAMEEIATAFAVMVSNANTNAGAQLVVYSRVGAVTTPVEQVWVDNAVDIQRRRGSRATERFIWP